MKVRTAVLAFALMAMLPPSFAQQVSNSQAAKQLFYLVNEARSNAGLPALMWNEQLAQAAERHAELMADHKGISHEYEGEYPVRIRLANTGLHMDRSGENVAADSTVKGAHIGLMNSPPHRANILSPDYNSIGIGVAHRADVFYVAQDFARVLPTLSPDEVEKKVASAFENLRRKQGLRPLTEKNNALLRERACEMAKADQVNARGAATGTARYTVAFTTSEPSQLPKSLEDVGDKRNISSFSVGACFSRTALYPAGVYWVIVELYSDHAAVPLR